MLGIGAFVLGSNESTTDATSASKVAQPSATKVAANKIASAPKVASESPTRPKDEEEDEGAEGYEARKAFVGVSPSQVKAGEKVKIELRGFAKNASVTVTVGTTTSTVKTDKNGKAELKVTAPKTVGTVAVSVTGTTSTGGSHTILKSFKVVVKK